MKVYIASPYTKGDVALNVKAQIDTASEIVSAGHTPFWPLSSHFLHMAHPQPYERWMELDLEWLLVCDMVLRLPGESAGADREVKLAQEHGIKVVHGMGELLHYMNYLKHLDYMESL